MPTEIRDMAIEIIVNNMLMAGTLIPEQVAYYMAKLHRQDNKGLAESLVESRIILDGYYKWDARIRRN